MKKLTSFICVLFFILAAISVPSAVAAETEYSGHWFCAYVDLGDGVLLPEYEGQSLKEMIYFDLNADGTALVTSMEESQNGTWAATDNGIQITVDDSPVLFVMQDGMLVNHEDEVVMYFQKTLPEPSAYTGAADFTGDWACRFVDLGDGVKLSEYEGTALPESIYYSLNADETAVLFSFGVTQSGTWSPTATGITITIDGQDILFVYQDEQLINNDDGVIMYFDRPEEKPQGLGFHDLVSISKAEATPALFSFAGVWKAVTYEVSGMTLDIQTALPDGLTITLLEDGTGTAQLTADYAETLSWSATADGITLSDTYLLFDPVWDAETEILTLSYAADVVRIGFQKTDEAVSPVSTPAATTAALPDSTPEPATSALPLVYTCDYFSAAFPADWEENEYGVYNWDQYHTMQYDLNDKDGWMISNLVITASVEEAAPYRSAIAALQETALSSGKDTLDELVVDGILFKGLVTQDYWSYAEYYARIPEASLTLTISVSAPDKIADILPDILQSIRFTFPIPNPPFSDPPMPEDGIAFIPSPASVTTESGYTLQAAWLPSGQSILPNDLYVIDMSRMDTMLYILTKQKLLSYSINNGQLNPAGDPIVLDEAYSCINADTKGSLYLTDGYYSLLTLSGSTATTSSLDGYLAMHPDGVWGLNYWSNNDVQKITFTEDGMATKPWALTNLSDDTTRQGRFNSIDYITITGDTIFVAGDDASTDYTTRVAMYDPDGNELAVFGSTEWTDDSYISSVAGIVQTSNGILVQDGFYAVYKLFSLDGTFLGDIRCDDLLGTSSAQPIAMVPSANGVYTLVSQERADQSATELLVFEITGF